MDQIKIGRFLAQLRKEKGLSQEALAEKIGVTNKTISRWETGTYMPDVEMMKILAEFFGVNVDELLSGERAETKPDTPERSEKRPLNPNDAFHDQATRFDISMRRLLAWIIDVSIPVCVSVILFCLMIVFDSNLYLHLKYVSFYEKAHILLPVALVLLKNIFFKNASIGKKLMRIEIVRVDDGKLPSKIILIGKAAISVFLFLIDGFYLMFTRGTSLGDKETKTRVIYSKSSKRYGTLQVFL